ncbi:two-component response regulator-like APRR5 isoform X2 [Hibiscus syriacus]|uniref:two-component response regulator-like APRR5 isoform X2 n=1 Tax=Hibiscus syriacus TaxID=106335 RepID=UPI00192043B5|nr:two-component response regulator-like APRR5 isoform X2 [Hibiscus syriacus]
MGGVLVSSEEVKTVGETGKGNGESGFEFEANDDKRLKTMNSGNFVSGETVNWGSFLPTMVLRVLLVEADDSTRQIVAALLRKCNYRVSAVPDGLKAWEVLKANPHNIDLILTEVDLPSISGFALLTLIMEHEICKSIPVIMMSSQDSISTVYKCMLLGAADYLVKPIRRNELRNLWQHVWRRQLSVAGGSSNPQDESVGQKKVEAMSENNAASNSSSGCLAGVERIKEQTKKGSEAQSSCTKPDMEAEGAHMENMPEFSWQEAQANSNQKLLMHEKKSGVVEPESQSGDTNILDHEASVALGDSPREAFDFMGTLYRNHNSSSINSGSKFGSSTDLDLSLRRCHHNAFDNHLTREKPILWHPNSSAFTRYSSRPSRPPHSTLTGASDQKKESGTNSEKILSNTEYNTDTPGPTLTSHRNMNRSTTGTTDKLKQTEVAESCTQRVPVPLKRARLNNTCDGYNSIIPPVLCAQTSSSLVPSPSSANQQDPACLGNPFRHPSFETNQSTNQPSEKPDQRLESAKDREHVSPIADQSASAAGSFCNGSLNQLDSIAYGSNPASNGNTESKNDDGFPNPVGNLHRLLQREAALNKFRLKRKDRCFEKKVRYESRKKLAEQRPRVKGQFVRQPQTNQSHTQAGSRHGNSSDG